MKKIFLPVDGATVLYNQKHSCIHQWLFAKCMSNIYHNFFQGSKRKTTKTFGMKENVEMFISTFQGYQRILLNKAKWFYSYWFCWFRYETCIIINCSSLLWRWRVSILYVFTNSSYSNALSYWFDCIVSWNIYVLELIQRCVTSFLFRGIIL